MASLTENFDVIIIGAGPGGYVCAIRCAQLGFKVACVEKEATLGGTCLNVGCIPSKALLESSHHYHFIQHEASSHGIGVNDVFLHLDKMIKRKEDIVSSMTQGVSFLFQKNKITPIKGFGSLKDPQTVAVKDDKNKTALYGAKHIIIASGSAPIELKQLAPIDHKIVVDSTDALAFQEVPKHLIVVGGGVIGLELGSVWSRLGSKVTVIEALPKILGSTDSTISTAAQKLFAKQGLTIHLETKVTKIEVSKNQGKVTAQQKDGKDLVVEGDKILFAIGRKPYTDNLNLEEVGVKKDDKGRIEVDSHYRTSVPSVYAIGDVIKGPMLAHKAEEEGVALAEMLKTGYGHVNEAAIPNVIYTFPEIATVGLSEEQCKEQDIPCKIGKFYFKANGRAKAMGATEGLVKVISHKVTDKLLGVHILGPMASELIGEMVLAFEFQASAEDIARTIHAHPTLSEVVKEAALDADKRAIHS